MYIHCTTKNTEKGKITNLLPRYVVLINTGLTSSFVSCPVYKSTAHNKADNIVERGITHHKPNQKCLLLFSTPICQRFVMKLSVFPI